MMRTLLWAVAAITMIVTASATEPAPRIIESGWGLIIPAHSPLRLRAPSDQDDYFFDGRATLAGTWHYGYDDEFEIFVAYLEPDAASLAILPYWRDRGHPDAIFFRNDDAFAKAVIPAATLRLLKTHKLHSATGKIRVVVENYEVTASCDHPDFFADFVAVEPGRTLVASKEAVSANC